MKKTECLIKGYEIGKNTRIHGDIKLAQEVAKIASEESTNLCLECKYANSTCGHVTETGVYPIYSTVNVGFSALVTHCDKFKPL